MLRQEAEQACGDLVWRATGRFEGRARSLARAVELTGLKTHPGRRSPIMNVFSAVASHLALRISRTLAGPRRMGLRSRVLAAVILVGTAAATLPNSGVADVGDGVDWETLKSTPPEEWSEELKAQIAAAGRDVEAVAERVRQGMVWRAAMAMDPDEWSEELKARILELKPGSTIEEIAEGIRQRREAVRANRERDDGVDWVAVKTTPPEEWSEKLRAQIAAAGHDVEAIAERVRNWQAEMGDRADSDLAAIGRHIRAAVEAGELTPEEGREKMAAARQRQAKARDGGSDLEAIARRIRAAVEAGKLTPEEGRERMAAARQRQTKARDGASDLEAIARRIRAAVEAGDLTPDEGRAKMAAVRQRLAAAADGAPDAARLRAYRRGVVARAMAAAPEEWPDELRAAIVRAGWDLAKFTEAIRERQSAADEAGETVDLMILVDSPTEEATAVEEATWGQVKAEVTDAE